MDRTYIAIDLKSFYASVECADRGLDPLTTNLVVADPTRTDKTICLAVTPSLKAYGIPGRARLFEVVQEVKKINQNRFTDALRLGVLPKDKFGNKHFVSESFDDTALKADPSLELSYITAPPRMKLYEEISTKIFSIYTRYISPEDIHVYSVDECFIDVTGYLSTYHMTAHELTMTLIREVLYETGITATAGIGTNMYLAKIAMDIVAKHVPADKDGVRIAELDEMSYRRKLWEHEPITDFWRIGKGIAKRLASENLFTMGDIARYSETNEDRLFKLFGVNAELIIDHAWGYEPTLISDIKSYVPENHSISQGQVLSCAYDFIKAKLIVREMTELLVLDLVRKKLAADQIVLTVGYDKDGIPVNYDGELAADHYGRKVPKPAHGSVNLGKYTSSTKIITGKTMELFDRIVDRRLMVRRMYVVANHVVPEEEIPHEQSVQYGLFDDVEKLEAEREQEKKMLEKEHSLQESMLSIKERFGKNAILKGMNFLDGATTIERNNQVGGHRA